MGAMPSGRRELVLDARYRRGRLTPVGNVANARLLPGGRQLPDKRVGQAAAAARENFPYSFKAGAAAPAFAAPRVLASLWAAPRRRMSFTVLADMHDEWQASERYFSEHSMVQLNSASDNGIRRRNRTR